MTDSLTLLAAYYVLIKRYRFIYIDPVNNKEKKSG